MPIAAIPLVMEIRARYWPVLSAEPIRYVPTRPATPMISRLSARIETLTVFEQDAVLERLMPALNLAPSLQMARRAPDMGHAPASEPAGQIAGDVTRSVVGQQPRPRHDLHLIEP